MERPVGPEELDEAKAYLRGQRLIHRERSVDLAEDLARAAPLSAQGSKRAIQTVVDHLSSVRNVAPDIVAEMDRLVVEAYNSADLQEGIAAMSEKRPPNFKGA